jgi:hypothetical protein
MSALLTMTSVIQCPHQGTVQPVTKNARVTFGSGFALRATDTFTVVGCPFTTPAGTPHPCVTVRWSSPAQKSTVIGDAPLTESSVGQCIAPDQAVQGVVSISSFQSRVSGT